MSSKRLARTSLLIALASLVALACASAEQRVRVRDAGGELRDPFAAAEGRRALVLVFVDPDCPISNAYAPEVKRLAAEYGPRGVAFELVYSMPATDAQDVRRHVADFAYELPALLDPEQRLALRAGVVAVPEAAVFLPDGELAYRGRIDDRYVDLGRRRAQPTRRDLCDALDAILQGRSPEVERTEAVGCPLPGPHGT
jgi:hypothetical protein